VPTVPGETQNLEHRALGMDMDYQRRGRRRPERREHGDRDGNASPRHHRPHIFIPEGIFFI
jgi:hypothetical protein